MCARIVLTTFGSYGDVHPYIGLALGLTQRGHEPIIATSEYYRTRIENAGIAFRAVRPDIDPTDGALVAKIMHPMHGSEVIVRDLAIGQLRNTRADLLAATEGADALITHPLTFAGRIVAEERGIPWISSVLAPMSFFSAHDLPVFAAAPTAHAARYLGLGASRSIIRMAKLASRHWADPVRAMRVELQLPPTEDPIFEGQHSPLLVLALFSRVLADPQPDWPSRTCITGSIFYDGGARETAPLPELERFLETGPAPIVFTLGSSAVGAAGSFYEESAAAVRALGARAVMLVGHDPRNRPSGSPSKDVLICSYAPYTTLLPRAAAIVHQGGVGTTVQALRAGKPTIVVPHAHDQADNAYRVERLGVSRTIYPRQYKGAKAAATLKALLEHPTAQGTAAVVAERVRVEDGVGVACREIDRVLGHGAK